MCHKTKSKILIRAWSKKSVSDDLKFPLLWVTDWLLYQKCRTEEIKSDQHQIYPCNIHALIKRVVIRVKDRITHDEFAWYFKTFYLLLLKEMCRGNKWELYFSSDNPRGICERLTGDITSLLFNILAVVANNLILTFVLAVDKNVFLVSWSTF